MSSACAMHRATPDTFADESAAAAPDTAAPCPSDAQQAGPPADGPPHDSAAGGGGGGAGRWEVGWSADGGTPGGAGSAKSYSGRSPDEGRLSIDGSGQPLTWAALQPLGASHGARGGPRSAHGDADDDDDGGGGRLGGGSSNMLSGKQKVGSLGSSAKGMPRCIPQLAISSLHHSSCGRPQCLALPAMRLWQLHRNAISADP